MTVLTSIKFELYNILAFRALLKARAAATEELASKKQHLDSLVGLSIAGKTHTSGGFFGGGGKPLPEAMGEAKQMYGDVYVVVDMMTKALVLTRDQSRNFAPKSYLSTKRKTDLA